MQILKKISTSILYIGVFSIGSIIGIIWTLLIGISWTEDTILDSNNNYSIRQSWFRFINPLLECELWNKIERQKYIPFENLTIHRIKNEVLSNHPKVTVGVYIRNLNNGPWFGINENEYYSPASIMKIPIFLTYLKWIELGPNIQNRKLILGDEDISYDHYFPPSKSLTPGKEYTIKELIEEMMIYSDNKSMNTLMKNIPVDLYKKVNQDLGITIPNIRTPEDFLSTKEIATFFRILYNASYLSRENSEYALNILSQVDFNKWLRAGVPNNIIISHKFWERWYTDESTWKYIRQLHDCGIIYYEKYPYLACITTKGDDFDENASIIANISKIVFEEISKAFPEK